jgi:hypothetical protein
MRRRVSMLLYAQLGALPDARDEALQRLKAAAAAAAAATSSTHLVGIWTHKRRA